MKHRKPEIHDSRSHCLHYPTLPVLVRALTEKSLFSLFQIHTDHVHLFHQNHLIESRTQNKKIIDILTDLAKQQNEHQQSLKTLLTNVAKQQNEHQQFLNTLLTTLVDQQKQLQQSVSTLVQNNDQLLKLCREEILPLVKEKK